MSGKEQKRRTERVSSNVPSISNGTLRLHKLVDGAFEWVMQNLELFDPFMNETEPDIHLSKAFSELAFMCMYYYRCMRENCDPRVKKFISFVHDVWQRPNYRERVVRYPNMLRQYLSVYIALLCCGIEDRSYHEIIQRIWDKGYASAVGEPMFLRGIDLRHMLDCGDFEHNLPSYEHLYQKTLLAKTPSLLYVTKNDVYSFTHTLFYLADYGFRPIDTIPEEQLPTVRWIIGTLLGIYLRARNWDLVAELLIACRCLRWVPFLIFEAALDALLDAQLPDGSVPGSKFSKEEMQKLNELEQKTYCFEQNYHTTLASTLACFLTDRWITKL